MYGCEFVLLTDYKPLEVIYSATSRTLARIERWVLRLQPYNYKVCYLPGPQNIALSRLSIGSYSRLFDDTEEYVNTVTLMNVPNALDVKKIEHESAKDPDLSNIKEYLKTQNMENCHKHTS